MKLCRKCLRLLPETCFPLQTKRNGKQYRTSPCRDCLRFAQANWRSRKGRRRNLTRRERYATDEAWRAAEIARAHAYYQAHQAERSRYTKRRKLAQALEGRQGESD